jgi:hypothetical protein
VYQGPTAGFGPDGGGLVELVPEHEADVDRLLRIIAADGHAPRRDDDRVLVAANGEPPRLLAASLNRAAADAGVVLAELHTTRPNLEAYYLATVEGGDR